MEATRAPAKLDLSGEAEISVIGQKGVWANRAEVEQWQGGATPIEDYPVNQDGCPCIINKTTDQCVV